LRPFRIAASATKKGGGDKNYAITPAHFAAINPNIKYLKSITETAMTRDMQDKKKRKPIHFAAASESSATLEWLLKNGANRNEPDDKGLTPLSFAARYGRAHNIALLVPLVTKSKAAELLRPPADTPEGDAAAAGAVPADGAGLGLEAAPGTPKKAKKKRRGGDDEDGDGDDDGDDGGDGDEGGDDEEEGGGSGRGRGRGRGRKRKAGGKPKLSTAALEKRLAAVSHLFFSFLFLPFGLTSLNFSH
jgi:ankyrin repeat protein